MLAKFSVNRPYTVIVGIIIVLILGAISVYNTTTDLLPNINLPYALVVTAYPGASPEAIELSVTRPIEQSMLTLSNIQNVLSVSADNVSLVILEFNETTNMDTALIEIRENLDMITSFMPQGINTPMIMRINPNLLPVSVLSAAVEGTSLADSSQFIKDTIIPEFERIAGIASVSATGLVKRELHISLNHDKVDAQKQKLQDVVNSMLFLPSLFGADLTAMLQDSGFSLDQLDNFEITADLVSGIIQGQNISMPAGYLTNAENSYLVRVGDQFRSVEELENLPLISLPFLNLPPITLADISDIELIASTDGSYTKVNGEDAVMLIFQKQTDYSTADIAKKIRARADELQKQYEGLQITTLMDQGIYIDMVLDSVLNNIIYGAILAIIVLLVFLRSARPTIVVAVSIPISIITSFVLMYFSNINLNIISMGGLALGVGMLVDNSIVVIESIYRLRSEGKSAFEAAVEGTKEVAGAITASTLTTIAVFLPIVFTYGLTREIFSEMALTISYSLGASLLVALTLVPMVASRIFTKEQPKENRFNERMNTWYGSLVNKALDKKAHLLIGVLILFVVSSIGIWRMGSEFLPATDSHQISMQVELPHELSASDAAAVIDQITAVLEGIEDIETIGVTSVGSMLGMPMSMGGSGSNSYSFYLLLNEQRSLSSRQIAQQIRDLTEGINADITVADTGFDISMIAGGAIVLNVLGQDLDTLQSIAKDAAAIVADVPGTIEVSDGLEDTAPELRIMVDKQKGITKGVTVGQVLMAVNQKLGSNTEITTLTVGTDDYSIFVHDPKNQASSEADLMELLIDSPLGEPARLGDIATIEQGQGLSSIQRRNQQRYISVTAKIADGYNAGNISREIEQRLDNYNLPEGYSIEFGGEQLLILESFDDLSLVLVVGILLIYLVMVAQFQSLLSPFIVMFTIPLAFTGGFLGLIINGSPLSLVAVIGLVILTGVVVNNGIVLIDYINQLRERGMAKREAIVHACRVRLRPILMTALTTIVGLSTMSIGVGMGTELIQPMAVTASSGLLYATILTLFVVPVLYDTFHRK